MNCCSIWNIAIGFCFKSVQASFQKLWPSLWNYVWKKAKMLARSMQLTKQLYDNSGDSSIKLKQNMNDLIDYSKSIFVHLHKVSL